MLTEKEKEEVKEFINPQNNGLLGYIRDGSTYRFVFKTKEEIDGRRLHISPVIEDAEGLGFKTGQVVVALDPITGMKLGGPATVRTFDKFDSVLVTSSSLGYKGHIYISGTQDELTPPKIS